MACSAVIAGGIKNIHQVGGQYAPEDLEVWRNRAEGRQVAEDWLSGLSLGNDLDDEAVNEVRPRSMVFEVTFDPKVKFRLSGADRYGEIVAVTN